MLEMNGWNCFSAVPTEEHLSFTVSHLVLLNHIVGLYEFWIYYAQDKFSSEKENQ